MKRTRTLSKSNQNKRKKNQSAFENIPTELIQNIAQYLKCTDFFNFTITCKKIHQSISSLYKNTCTSLYINCFHGICKNDSDYACNLDFLDIYNIDHLTIVGCNRILMNLNEKLSRFPKLKTLTLIINNFFDNYFEIELNLNENIRKISIENASKRIFDGLFNITCNLNTNVTINLPDEDQNIVLINNKKYGIYVNGSKFFSNSNEKFIYKNKFTFITTIIHIPYNCPFVIITDELKQQETVIKQL